MWILYENLELKWIKNIISSIDVNYINMKIWE